MATSIILVLISFAVLAAAWYWRKQRRFHIAAMITVMVFDLLFPVYLYLTHDWGKRLIDDGEIFSFLIWSHLMLIMVLYALYVLQVLAGRSMLAHPVGDKHKYHRDEHQKQFLGIVIVRLLVFASGWLLMVPDSAI
ncbi:hypothetical protein JYT48_00555 [Mariprofundus ferrooxydans]|nr:hypothetical protein [Mariprofundus ferrooxydans]MBN4076746.1 hypothetical protein [Mariprofundus ferrooxydans]